MNRSLILSYTLFVIILLLLAAAFDSEHRLHTPAPLAQSTPRTSQVASVASSTTPTIASTSSQVIATTSAATSSSPTVKKQTKKSTVAKVGSPTKKSSTNPNQVERIQDPYDTPPLSFETINTQTRPALVNILCQPKSGPGSVISGSGVIIDPRGIILTNAHVAQYILLSESASVDLSCTIRTSSPAMPKWHAHVLYIPPVWVDQHAKDLAEEHPTGTGEHDYALLAITSSTDGMLLPSSFPFIKPDTRANVAFTDDSVLVAGYPAEFVGGLVAQNNLYAVSSVATVRQLFTFAAGTIDVLSLGGPLEAQGGSSGGPVINAWGKLVALVTTTSAGTTTSQRDLHATTLSYIDADLTEQNATSLSDFLDNIPYEAEHFDTKIAPDLLKTFVPYLAR